MISIRSKLSQTGYLYLPSYHPDASTDEIARSLGTPLALANRSPVHQLKPKSAKTATPNTYSGVFGYGGFPLHTDLAHWRFPPRFLMLRCITGFAAVPTLLVDGAAIIDDENRSIFSRALVRPPRPIDGSMPLLRLYGQQDGQGLLRWDEVFIRPASPTGEVGLRKFGECLARIQPVKIALATSGDTLILDNWRMLHGRSPVPPGCQGRLLDRAYLEELH
jgi:L-asparagine oxygenase